MSFRFLRIALVTALLSAPAAVHAMTLFGGMQFVPDSFVADQHQRYSGSPISPATVVSTRTIGVMLPTGPVMLGYINERMFADMGSSGLFLIDINAMAILRTFMDGAVGVGGKIGTARASTSSGTLGNPGTVFDLDVLGGMSRLPNTAFVLTLRTLVVLNQAPLTGVTFGVRVGPGMGASRK